MLRFAGTWLLWVLMGLAAFGQGLQQTEVDRGGWVELRSDEPVAWMPLAPWELDARQYVVTDGDQRAYVIVWKADDGASQYVVASFANGDPVPRVVRYVVTVRGPPVPPTPPVPPPGPDPPVPPSPPAEEEPFPSSGLAVMVIREAGISNLPVAQRAIFTDEEVRNWLQANVVRVGNDPFVRFWDDDYTDSAFDRVPEHLKVAYEKTKALSKGQVPYMAISKGTGKGGWHGPLPATVDAMLEKLEEVAK